MVTTTEFRDFYGYLQLQFKECKIIEHDFFDQSMMASQATIGRYIYRITRLTRPIERLDMFKPMQGFEKLPN